MIAVRLPPRGRAPVRERVRTPRPSGTEVLVRVEAAGLCHSDLHVLDDRPGWFRQAGFTLGHEVAGHVAEPGPRAGGVEPGERVAVYGPWGCGDCGRCGGGAENYCERRSELGWAGAGLGIDGGMAEYLLVPSSRHLARIGDLDAAQAAALCDAGLTSYHAITGGGLAARLGADTSVAVIGVGGLGHVAIQLLRALTPSRVVALDVRDDAVALARESGAHAAMPVQGLTPPALRDASGARGFDAVLDFVGSDATLELAAKALLPRGELVLVGSAGGRLTVRKPGGLPPGFRLSVPYWGTRPELDAVLALARSGAVRVRTESLPLRRASEAFDRLRAGGVSGRMVLMTGDDDV